MAYAEDENALLGLLGIELFKQFAGAGVKMSIPDLLIGLQAGIQLTKRHPEYSIAIEAACGMMPPAEYLALMDKFVEEHPING